jgi:hypothetical protein
MKKEIVYTDKYALILSDEEAHVDDKNVYLDLKKGIYRNLLAHLPLSDAPILKGVPLLPPLPKEDDVYEMAQEYAIKSHSPNREARRKGFVDGYNKAKEKYKYTEFDIIQAFEYGWNQRHFGKMSEDKLQQIQQTFIQSLQQPSRFTHFECETITMNLDEIREQGKGFLNANIYKIKTKTNSQGHVELVGKYLNL